ncbi:MAG: M6 family metalloprotease domain-containing protein, partial [Paludibacteraceae bacterium]|nr:M6 family metalloprotease domain-containing protein [Paludibacteraceae bacterium]
MKRIVIVAVLCSLVMAANAVPARRGWQTRTQADGTTIEVQVIGDEFYHYTINRDGKQVREINGMYEVIGEAPSPAVAKARRAKAVARRQRKDIGTQPNLAPKGVVILVNFSDKNMQSGHTQATFDELCNSTNCTVNAGYPSAAQYFADQSNGAYRPQFDVFGPVTLSRNVAYYGTDGDKEGDDQHATDAVIEGCRLANEQFTINWADYDSDNDGYVDFVYVIYAGKGQADGGTSETIWPHNWSVESARYYGNCTYSASECKVGGKKIDNYAMSGEMSRNSLGGIGTLCHEFGHVLGLPDLYDTDYGTVYDNNLTPNDWDIMDGGSYNGDGHCPPNYDPWEKEFFGWHTTVNLGNEGQNVTLYANGTENYQAYQITSNGNYVGPTTAGLRYYIENRQAVGWDAPLTGHGMLIWKVNFNESAWENNAPNNSE